jgi:hypothetical protein
LKKEGYKVIPGRDFDEKQNRDNIIAHMIYKENTEDLLRRFEIHKIPTFTRGSTQSDNFFFSTSSLE